MPLADLPETPVILALLAELLPNAAAPLAPPVERPRELAGWSWGTFLGRVNWRNESVVTPEPAAVEVPPVLGDLTVGAYFALVNWRNDPQKVRPATPASGEPTPAPAADADSLQVGSLSEFAWD
jgi:hypothetical protein